MAEQQPGISRRQVLIASGSAVVLTGAALLARSGPPADEVGQVGPTRYQYGDDPSQFGDLYLPCGKRRNGTILLLHGGFWRAAYGVELTGAIAEDLARRGWVVWNLEYRRIGDGGGWPQTLSDIATGTDHLARMAERGIDLDLKHVVALGHASGGQLAAWLANRRSLPAGKPGSGPVVEISSVLSQSGILDLTRAVGAGTGARAIIALLGGDPSQRPQRYALADPIQQVPLEVPVVCLHSRSDGTVPFRQSAAYVEAATRAGGEAHLVEVGGGHFALVNPTTRAWSTLVQLLPEFA